MRGSLRLLAPARPYPTNFPNQ